MKRPSPEVNAALDRLLLLVQRHRTELQGLRGESLADWLYLHWYVTPAVAFDRADMQALGPTVGGLMRASLDLPAQWQAGWVALEVTPGQTVLAGCGVQRRWLPVGDHANLSRPGAPVVPGDGLATFGLLTWVDAPTGFQGLRHWRSEPQGALVRVYLSVALPALPQVLRRLVPMLVQASVKATEQGPNPGSALARPGPVLSWSLKCPSQAVGYGRVDSLVLYLERAQWPQTQRLIADLVDPLAPWLRDATPPLTQRLGRGVAFAQDPQNSQSFGQSRCLALATAVQAHLQSGLQVPPQDRGPAGTSIAADGSSSPLCCTLSRRRLKAALRRAGIDPQQPWLCANPTDAAEAVAPAALAHTLVDRKATDAHLQ
jgi:HopA1 effector protein family